LIRKLERTGPLEFVCVNRRIILKTVLQKYDGNSWTLFQRLRIGQTGAVSYEHVNGTAGFGNLLE
jgi:hypothetical protein